MGQVRTVAHLVPLVVILAPAAGFAQDVGTQHVAGSAVYRTYCAVCHGPAGKGDGPLADSLRVKVPDITLLARKNKGTFPKDQVLRIVDGRKPVKGHGGTDMPVWGDAFKQATDGYSEAAVKEKIEAVVGHLETIQER
ncbi:MAG TPA: c-type cytochrome [Vicinamibacteria bacterium]